MAIYRTVLTFDMRAPDFGASSEELYDAALDMCAFGDEIGIGGVVFPEHHGSPDGYNPSPALMAAAASVRTKRMEMMLGAIVLPLHDPVEVAETIAVADHICGGRLTTTFAAGYVQSEFKMFGKSLSDRPRLIEEGLDVITRALAGERFDYQGREVFVRPLPRSQPVKLMLGGSVPAVARRAAKFGVGLWVLQPQMMPDYEKLVTVYKEECGKLGRQPGLIMSSPPLVHVARDPEEAWAKIGPHVLHLAKSYASWAGEEDTSQPFHGIDTVEKVRAMGFLSVMTPEQTVEFANTTPIALMPLVGGLSPKIGWEMLELFAAEVMPKLRSV